MFRIARAAARRPLLPLVAAAALVAAVTGTASAAPRVWFGPSVPLQHGQYRIQGADDFSDLFKADAPWQDTASRIQVFKLYGTYILQTPDDQLSAIFKFLGRRHIALAVEFGPLTPGDDKCGTGVEGFSGGEAQGATLARKVKSLGGEIAFVAMDEPLWFGGIADGSKACKWSAREIAENANATVKGVHSVFPQAVFGDIEPLRRIDGDLIGRYAEWIDAWKEATGAPLGFFHADVLWGRGGDAMLKDFAAMLQQKGVPFGIIYNGDSTETSDATWTDAARRRYEAYEAENLPPADAVFQSWNPYPKQLLPDTQPGTFTNLLRGYSRGVARFASVEPGGAVSGRLEDGQGRPIAGATIALQAKGGSGGQFEQSVEGTVPRNAAKMMIAWRANTECGGCSGDADVLVRPPRFEAGGPAAVMDLHSLRGNSPQGAMSLRSAEGGGDAVRIRVAQGQKLASNGSAMPVSPGAPFKLSVPYEVVGPTGNAVSVQVLFLNDQGKEVGRKALALAPQWGAVGEARTDSSGAFRIEPKGGAEGGPYQLVFAGDDSHRSASVSVP